MSSPTPELIARITATVRRRGLIPREPYPGSLAHWHMDCARCGTKDIRATWAGIRDGCDPCATCAYRRRSATLRAARRTAA